MPRWSQIAVALTAAAVLCGGCGRGADRNPGIPAIGVKGTESSGGTALGFPVFATKNTTRVGGADPVANAAAVALATFPAQSPTTRPAAVALADAGDWRAALAASVLMSAPLRAPLLLTAGGDLPGASSDALAHLRPTGLDLVNGAQVIRVGNVARPKGLRHTDVAGGNPYALARALDAFVAAARGRTSPNVVVVAADAPQYAMPAAAWAAKSGDAILFVTRRDVPPETADALRTHKRPHIFVLGPPAVVGGRAVDHLRRFGPVTRIAGSDPSRNAIAFARFAARGFGWGVVDPGHGLVFANATRPLDAPAAAALSASGTYGPLLLLPDGTHVPRELVQYLLDIQPGYRGDPVRGVYNHAWLMGDTAAISTGVQARIDALIEIVPVGGQSTP